jgi:Pvc16 N-terminal domain
VRGLISGPGEISQESPVDLETSEMKLSIYLYRVSENPSMKNQPPTLNGGGVLLPTPLTLDLFYLVTPLIKTALERHMILGKVLQVFHDRPILQAPELVGELEGADDEFRIVLNPVSAEETARIWQAMAKSYRLSVCYTVRVALIDSTRTQPTRPVAP